MSADYTPTVEDVTWAWLAASATHKPEHITRLVESVRAEERARTDMWAATAGDYLALILPLMSKGERVSFEATGALPSSLAARIAREGA